MKSFCSKTCIFSSILLSFSLVLLYYLKSSGFSSVLIFLSVFLTTLLFSFLSVKKVRHTEASLGALFFFLLSLPLASRGPSLNNLLFFISLSPFFSYLLEGRENKKFPAAMFLAPVFSIWAIVGNWEFPSVFSPFVVYGKRELAFLSASIVLAAGRNASRKGRLVSIFLSLALLIPAADMYLRSELHAFSELKNLSSGTLPALLALSASAALFWLETERGSETRAINLFRTLIPVPVLLTASAWLQHALKPLLPLPFNPDTVIFAVLLSLSLYLLSYVAPAPSFRPFFFLAGALFFVRLFAPAELNIYDYGGVRYGNYSLGLEHLGPLFFVWIFILLGSSDFSRKHALPLLLASALSVTRLYFTRLYHFSSAAPVEFFKDLGSEGVSWVRKPVVPHEPYYALLLAVIISTAYFAVMRTLFKERSAP